MNNLSPKKYKIQPIILCGGSGTRLWPLSTSKIPKQFINLGEKGTLLEETIRRINILMTSFTNFDFFDPILIMHKNHVLPFEYKNVFYEEYSNDTAIAVFNASIYIKNLHEDENIIIICFPADHYIDNVDFFINDVKKGIESVNDENIVLFGINPTSPESKYGYIIPTSSGLKFKEKPDKDLAIRLIKQGASWNSGIFAATNNLILSCLQKSKYNLLDWINFPREGKAPSFDVAILQEHPHLLSHLCLNWGWSDVGSWSEFIEIPEIKKNLNESSYLSKSNNINIVNRGSGNIVVIGCSDLTIVRNGNDILVLNNKLDYNNELKLIATNL